MREDHGTWDYRNPYEWMKRVRRTAFPPMMVAVAITGGVHGKELNPALPETPEEQAEQTYEAYQAGASLVHIHARDPERWWDCTGSAEQYQLIHRLIRQKCPDIIINDTTGGAWGMPIEERLKALDANPEIATLNMGPDMVKLTLKERSAPLPHPRNPIHYDACFPVSFGEVTQFAAAMKEHGIKPEMELYNPSQYAVVHDVIAQGLVDPPYLIQFVTGYISGNYPTPANLLGYVNELPDQSVFFVAGIGPFQLPMTVLGMILGGHVRVGMEDNVYHSRGRLYASNAEAVDRISRIAHELGREIATPLQAREMLGLPQQPSEY